MTDFPYSLHEDENPKLGLIVLQVDETIEQDFRRLFTPNVAQIYVSRVPSGDELTPDSISRMESQLATATALLPPAVDFDTVAYACTSGAALIGPTHVEKSLSEHTGAQSVTDPLTAALAATKALGIRRIGIVSPYLASIGSVLVKAFEETGLVVPETLSFGEKVESRVARIDPKSTAQAARTIASRNDIDGLFLSCTNLKTLDIINDLEAELGLPVLSSNQVLGWHMAKLAGGLHINPVGQLLGG